MAPEVRVWMCLLGLTSAFYIPGFSIKSYSTGDPLALFTNKVYSDNSGLQFAYSELPFVCPASGLIQGSDISLNLGEVLRGDRIKTSDYELSMLKDDEIHHLCTVELDRAAVKNARDMVAGSYVAEWIVDNLPSATSFVTVDRRRKYYARGWKLGYKSREGGITAEPRYFLNNHVTIVIRYHTAPGKDGQHGKKVIVGFEVFPKSIGMHDRDENMLPKDIHNIESGMELSLSQNMTRASTATEPSEQEDEDAEEDSVIMTIPYTYSVYFREEEGIEWHNRWDPFFVNQEDSSGYHWLAIINAIVIASLLGCIVVVILSRTLRGDIKGLADHSIEDGRKRRVRPPRSPRKSVDEKGVLEPLSATLSQHDDNSDDELVEDIASWKLVHADVFRTPAHGNWLAPLIGSGTQLLFMISAELLLSCVGILNPSFRGGVVSVGVGLFVLAGLLSGYFSARVYKTFGGTLWKQNALITAGLLPGLLFATTFILNLFVWAQASSTALPFSTLVALVALWVGIQLPLVHVGSWLGFERMGAYTHPLKSSTTPRQIPSSAWWTSSIHLGLLTGLVPFIVIFIELLFIFKSTWQDKSGYYYQSGFLIVVFLLSVVAVAEVTIISVYAMLCYENYHWWWYSFLTGAASGVWVFLYCVYFFFTKLHIQGFISSLLFFSYSFLACAVYSLLMGTVAWLTAYVFVRRIYGAIKVD